MEVLRVAAVLWLGTGLALAQTTHVVGPGGFAHVNDALAVAAPGDEILVLPGVAVLFTATIPVTIRAAVPGTTTLPPPSLSFNQVSLPAGQHLHLVDLKFGPTWITGGQVTCDGCTIVGSLFSAMRAQNASVALQGCQLANLAIGSGATFAAVNSNVVAIDCSFSGLDTAPPPDFSTPGIAIDLQGSVFHGSRIVASGGNGAYVSVYQPKPALRALGSMVWISDSQLATGGYLYGTGPQPCAVVADAGRLDRCGLTPPNCPPAIPTSGLLLGVHRQAPMQSPGALGLEYRTEANGLVAVFLADEVASFSLPGLEQPIWLDAATVRPLALVLADGTGLASYTCTIPVGLNGHTFWFQGVAPADPLLLSPVAGGVVR